MWPGQDGEATEDDIPINTSASLRYQSSEKRITLKLDRTKNTSRTTSVVSDHSETWIWIDPGGTIQHLGVSLGQCEGDPIMRPDDLG